jgi:integrase/recombinase XerD
MVSTPVGPESSRVTFAVAGFLDTCRSSNTRAAYGADLAHLAGWCRKTGTLDLLTVDADDIARYRTACEVAGASPATVARRLSTITSFGAFAAATGAEPALTGDQKLARPTVADASTAEVLGEAEAAAVLAAADQIGPRSAAVVRLLMLDGLKLGEVIGADARDLAGRPPRMTLALEDPRSRIINLHADTSSALRTYLGRRHAGPLVLSERRGCEADRLTRFGLNYLVKQVAQAAALAQPISANTLRRRYVIAAHAGGTDLETIRYNAGHAERRTTRRYLDLDREARA